MLPDTVRVPLKFPVLALSIHLCDVVPSAVPTVLEKGFTPVPPDDVIPADVIATLTDELPSDIVDPLANNPFDVAFIVPDPNPVEELTWPVIDAPAPLIIPDVSIVLAEITNLFVEFPIKILFDVGKIDPDVVILPVKSPVFADITNLPILLPNNIVLDVGVIAVALATRPLVVKLAEFTRLEWYAPVVFAIKLVPTVSDALFTEVVTFAKPVIDVFPLLVVEFTVRLLLRVVDPPTVKLFATLADVALKFHFKVLLPNKRPSESGRKSPEAVPA